MEKRQSVKDSKLDVNLFKADISEVHCSRERLLCDLRALEMSSGGFIELSNETAQIYTSTVHIAGG